MQELIAALYNNSQPYEWPFLSAVVFVLKYLQDDIPIDTKKVRSKAYKKEVQNLLKDAIRERNDRILECMKLKRIYGTNPRPLDNCIAYYTQSIEDIELVLKRFEDFLKYSQGKKESLDIERAKQVPIDTFVKFDRFNSCRCLFHDEKTASMKYYPKNNSVYCFGCGKKADVIDIYMHLYHVDFVTAVKTLTI